MARKKVEVAKEPVVEAEKAEDVPVVEMAAEKVEAPTDDQIAGLKAGIADAAARVAKVKARVAFVESRVAHLAEVVDGIRGASTPEKQAARFEEAEKMLKELFD